MGLTTPRRPRFDAKPLKVDMALLRVDSVNGVPMLLVGVLLGPLVLAGCMGGDSEGTPTVQLVLEPSDDPFVVGGSATIGLRLEGEPVQATRAGLAVADSSTDAIEPGRLVEEAFDETHWTQEVPAVPGTLEFEIDELPDEPFLYLRGVLETTDKTYWSDELRIALGSPEPPLAFDVRLFGLPQETYQDNLHDVRINITGDAANTTQVGFAWSTTPTSGLDRKALRPSGLDDHRVVRDEKRPVPDEFRSTHWSVPTNTTLYLRAWAVVDGEHHWSNETVIKSNDPPVVDHKVSEVDHLVRIEPSLLPLALLASYAPDPIEIQRGETLQWVNEDESVHTASHDANETAFHTGTLSSGVSSQVFRFLVPGEYTYECRVHPETMEGTVVVTE